jgi:hypothetical protein
VRSDTRLTVETNSVRRADSLQMRIEVGWLWEELGFE